MSKFKRDNKDDSPSISTASLPDIVFMLLFFFMVATVMREDTPLTENSVPNADQLEKLEKKELTVNIYIGKAKQGGFKNQEVIQLDDKIVTDPSKVRTFVSSARNSMPEEDQGKMIVNLKVDSEASMGILTDVKQQLRKANALKVAYGAKRGDVLNNISN